MTVYPNQKVVTVFKDECTEDFLQIKNDTWQAACSNLTYSAFKLYLYIASNKNGYTFALSYEAVNDIIPMHRNTYDKCIRELVDMGHLHYVNGNTWHFNV